MRIVSYRRDDGAERSGSSTAASSATPATDLADLAPATSSGRLDDVTLLAPVPRPGKVVCVGRNYAEHAAETGSAVPDRPQLFAKWANAVVGPGCRRRAPRDHHAARLRGRARRGDRPDRAPRRPSRGRSTWCSATRAATTSRLATCSSATPSGSAGRRSTRSRPWARGSSPPTRSPIPQALAIRVHRERRDPPGRHDGATCSSASPRLIAFVTEAITLEPGDLIFTGTPPGVGPRHAPAALPRASATASGSRSTASARSSTRSSRRSDGRRRVGGSARAWSAWSGGARLRRGGCRSVRQVGRPRIDSVSASVATGRPTSAQSAAAARTSSDVALGGAWVVLEPDAQVPAALERAAGERVAEHVAVDQRDRPRDAGVAEHREVEIEPLGDRWHAPEGPPAGDVTAAREVQLHERPAGSAPASW